MKKIGISNILMLIFSAFVSVCYLPYLISIISRGERASSFVIPAIVVILAIVPTVLLIKNRGKLNRFWRVFKCIYICSMCFYTVSFTIFTSYIAFSSHHAASVHAYAEDDGGKDDIILVFGCRTYGYTPSRQLKARLDAAYELLNYMPDAICIVSGAEGKNEGVAEALSMEKYLIERGIDKARIYTEAKSHNTYENIKYSLELIEEKGLKYDRIIGVSTDFHLPRIEYLFDYYGVENATTAAASSIDAWQFFLCVVREYMAYAKLFLVT